MDYESQALTPQDLATLERCYITPELANQAGIFRVLSRRGAELVGRRDDASYGGVAFPYCWPSEDSARDYRLRRDTPDLEQQLDGSIKEKGKYLSPPGRSNLLYFVPGIPANLLGDPTLPIVITEGEKKALALYNLSLHNTATGTPRFLPIGLAGVWGWRGRVGKTTDHQGARRDVKGVIPDFDRIYWQGRDVTIIFDANVASNESVAAARDSLAVELTRRGASVRLVDLPQCADVNGVDDLLAFKGPDYVLALIDAARSSTETEGKRERKSQATRLVELASDVELFHTSDGDAYASFKVGGHLETWKVTSRGFREYLTRQLYETEHKAPAAQSIQESLNVLTSRARFDGEAFEVHIRIAHHDDAIYVDLVDDAWRIAKISTEGWHIIAADASPVRFRRSRGMLALPDPVPGCAIDSLREFVNISNDQWPLLLAGLVAWFRPNYPFPLLALHGEQGSAKSTTARILRALIDPNRASLRSEPRDERDLMIAATNGWVVALDNLSRIPPSLSDALCRLATGGGFGTRKLYENDEEVLFDAKRPVLINGIEELATRSDLLDRALVLTLPTIPDDKRRTESELWEEFERKRPGILGALLDAVSHALCNVADVRLARLPRMADFAQWAVAAEPALGLPEGAFMGAYIGNRVAANDLALESSPASTLIVALVEDCGSWEGNASELLTTLASRASDELKKQHGWPKSAQAMGGILKRLAPNLRAVGINAERGSGRERRVWTLEKSDNCLSPLSRLSPDGISESGE